VALPSFLPVRQNFPDRSLKDIPGTVRNELASSGLDSRLAPGARVAVAVGSRGIANIAEIAGAVVGFWKSAGFRPFIFPAMGSHGGGTGEGQAHTLAGYGITEASMGCPIVSSLDVLSIGVSEIGAEAHVSRDAWQSDGVFMIGRVKWHTSFAGPLESGLTKMIAIGLGKLEGARTAHAYARRLGMDNVIRSVGTLVLSQGKILGGLAIVEGFSHETAHLEVLPSERLIDREVELLQLAKSWMPKIPVPAVDLLIVDEIGKNISGTGMDLKVVNRGAHGQYNPWPDTPKVERIFIRSLTTQSGGNAVGMGLADAIHDRVLERVDVSIGRLNALTSGSIATVRTPLHFPSDREGIEFLSATVGKLDNSQVTMAWIRNTIEVGTVALSENLRGEIEKNPKLEITGPAFPLSYDSAGNLPGAA
jgi:hypothetical protein